MRKILEDFMALVLGSEEKATFETFEMVAFYGILAFVAGVLIWLSF